MLARRIDQPKAVRLSSIDPGATPGLSQEEAPAKLLTLCAELAELQELLYAAKTHALLVVLQGRDTSGKDGTIKQIAGAMNPVGTRVASFKVPTPDELAHDFLWRVHAQTPGRGEVVFFNRSHYEDILVVRVHELVPEKVWKRRFDHIDNFERLLTDSEVLLVKFYLHISKEEQERRLLEREEESQKAWKLNVGDWQERKFWDRYTEAYEDAIGKCSSANAPWHLIPADKKWYRNVAVAEALVETLRPHRKVWQEKLDRLGAEQKAALDTMRRGGSG